MKSVLVTGSSGLIGSACVEKFSSMGWKVIGVDNNMRAKIFGSDGSTKKTGERYGQTRPGNRPVFARNTPDRSHHEKREDGDEKYADTLDG